MVGQTVCLFLHFLSQIFTSESLTLRKDFGTLVSTTSLIWVSRFLIDQKLVGPFFEEAKFWAPVNSVNDVIDSVRINELLQNAIVWFNSIIKELLKHFLIQKLKIRLITILFIFHIFWILLMMVVHIDISSLGVWVCSDAMVMNLALGVESIQ